MSFVLSDYVTKPLCPADGDCTGDGWGVRRGCGSSVLTVTERSKRKVIVLVTELAFQSDQQP